MGKKSSYKRILLKLSGEALMGQDKCGIDREACLAVASVIWKLHETGVEMGIVVGGGNIFRGSQAKEFGFLRTPADQIGMLATTINGLVIQQLLSTLGCESRVVSALDSDAIVEKYRWQKAMSYLQERLVVIFVGGTGHPYFTTDTAAALRANEIGADVLIKATKVDGIYDKDPVKHADAVKFDHLTYEEALHKRLDIMDATAIALCRVSQIPIHVVSLFKKGALLAAVSDKQGGSLVTGDE